MRRSSSVPCKSNRDSSSSNDSGVFELPRRPQMSANVTLPRRSKSSDPLRDLSFQFNKAATEGKSASAEAEVPVRTHENQYSIYDKVFRRMLILFIKHNVWLFCY